VDRQAIQWRNISALEMIYGLIEGQCQDSAAFYETLQQVGPGVLAKGDIERTKRAYEERREWIGVYREQLQRWTATSPTTWQIQRIDEARSILEKDENIVEKVLALNASLTSIEKILNTDEAELALRVLSGETRSPTSYGR
jgi:hypothetical protein